MALALEYVVQLETANFVVRSPFTLAAAASSRFMSGVIGMNAVNQSIGWLFSSRLYLLRKSVFGPPRILGSIGIASLSCLEGDFFLLLSFLRLRVNGDARRGLTYLIFSLVPVKTPRWNLSTIAYFGFLRPSISVGGR